MAIRALVPLFLLATVLDARVLELLGRVNREAAVARFGAKQGALAQRAGQPAPDGATRSLDATFEAAPSTTTTTTTPTMKAIPAKAPREACTTNTCVLDAVSRMSAPPSGNFDDVLQEPQQSGQEPEEPTDSGLTWASPSLLSAPLLPLAALAARNAYTTAKSRRELEDLYEADWTSVVPANRDHLWANLVTELAARSGHIRLV